MKKGLIILGPQGSGKTRLAYAIAARYDERKVAEIDASNISVWNGGKAETLSVIIVDGLTQHSKMENYMNKWFSYKLIFTSNCLEEKDFPEYIKDYFTIITLK